MFRQALLLVVVALATVAVSAAGGPEVPAAPKVAKRVVLDGLIKSHNAGGWNNQQKELALWIPDILRVYYVHNLLFSSREDYDRCERYLNCCVRLTVLPVTHGANNYLLVEQLDLLVLPADKR